MQPWITVEEAPMPDLLYKIRISAPSRTWINSLYKHHRNKHCIAPLDFLYTTYCFRMSYFNKVRIKSNHVRIAECNRTWCAMPFDSTYNWSPLAIPSLYPSSCHYWHLTLVDHEYTCPSYQRGKQIHCSRGDNCFDIGTCQGVSVDLDAFAQIGNPDRLILAVDGSSAYPS